MPGRRELARRGPHGIDEQRREGFSFLPGKVAADLDPAFSDESLASDAQLIRGYHDTTAVPMWPAWTRSCAVMTSRRATSSSVTAGEQARRIAVFCEAYGIKMDDPIIDAIVAAVDLNIDRLRVDRALCRRPVVASPARLDQAAQS